MHNRTAFWRQSCIEFRWNWWRLLTWLVTSLSSNWLGNAAFFLGALFLIDYYLLLLGHWRQVLEQTRWVAIKDRSVDDGSHQTIRLRCPFDAMNRYVVTKQSSKIVADKAPVFSLLLSLIQSNWLENNHPNINRPQSSAMFFNHHLLLLMI